VMCDWDVLHGGMCDGQAEGTRQCDWEVGGRIDYSVSCASLVGWLFG